MINLSEISASIGGYIAPFLPVLMSSDLVKDGIKEIGKGIGKDTWEKVKQIWSALQNKINGKPDIEKELKEIATEIQSKGKGAEVGFALRKAIEKIIADDPDVLKQLADIIKAAEKEENQGAAFNIKKQIAKYITNIQSATNTTIGDRQP